MASTKLLTAASLMDLLCQIDEFKQFDIDLIETYQKIVLKVNDSMYSIMPDESTVVDAESDKDLIEDIVDAQNETYSQLVKTDQISDESTVEGGIVKEALKTLLIGGMVRLGSKLLKK